MELQRVLTVDNESKGWQPCWFCSATKTEYSDLYEQWLCETCNEKLGNLCRQYSYDMHDPKDYPHDPKICECECHLTKEGEC